MADDSVFSAPPVFADIEAAAKRLKGRAVRTPLLESDRLNDETGVRILVKAEMLQRTGSFKFRGAYNRIAMIDEALRKTGVAAYSSGNHAQAVALAARLFGVPAAIVMPKDAPASKIEGTRAFGAEVILYDRLRESREAIGEALARDRAMTLVRPYDDAGVIAGQGTIGLEIADDMDAMGAEADVLAAPASGGGMVAGIALALERRAPAVRVFSAEPEGYDDFRRSLAAGKVVANPPGGPATLADALMAPAPGTIPFAVSRDRLAGGLVAGNADMKRAMRALFRHFKLVAEPGGAAALGAVLADIAAYRGKTIAVVCSGGNVDGELFRRALAETD